MAVANSAISNAYDALGRLTSRTVAGAGAETFQFDAIGRLITHASDLGSFTLSYIGQTSQVSSRQLTGSTLATTCSYLPNSGDRRLAGVSNVGLATGQQTAFTYSTNAEGFTTGSTQTSDAAIPYPPAPLTQTASYNALNQLTSLSGQTLNWDANGNLLSDGTRTYTWDAKNRLIGIVYPGQPGKATAFNYDGLSRRVTTTSTPAGGSPVATSTIWCGSAPCQTRSSSGGVLRSYYAEGELAAGSSPQSLLYGLDQLGSVRRVFASPTIAPVTDYDPYGNRLQSTAPTTDYAYAGLIQNTDSGLLLATYRAYDPVTGRWLSRDPIGEVGDPSGNLYAYVGGNPTDFSDSNGKFLANAIGAGIGAVLGGVTAGVGVYINNPNASASTYAEAIAVGVAVGAVSGFFLNPSGAVAVSTLASGAGDAIGQYVATGQINPWEVGAQAAIGGVSSIYGALWGGVFEGEAAEVQAAASALMSGLAQLPAEAALPSSNGDWFPNLGHPQLQGRQGSVPSDTGCQK